MSAFEQEIINSTDRADLLVWWTSQEECEAIVAINPLWSDYDATIEGVPDTIHSEFCSRYGRNGRGRLWAHDDFGVVGIPWDTTTPASRLAGERGGIVIWAKDAAVVFGLPGFLTDMALNVLNELPQSDEEDFPFITSDLRCSACGYQFDIELMHSYDYQIDRSGVQPGTEHGPAVYWNEGTIACPGCGVRLDYSEQSD